MKMKNFILITLLYATSVLGQDRSYISADNGCYVRADLAGATNTVINANSNSIVVLDAHNMDGVYIEASPSRVFVKMPDYGTNTVFILIGTNRIEFSSKGKE